MFKAPKKKNVIICDDIRHETGHKVSLLGVYSGVLSIPSEFAHFPLSTPQLAIWASFDPLKTSCTTYVTIRSPSGKTILESPKEIMPANKDAPTVIALKMVNPELPEAGVYKITYHFNDQTVTDKFEILVGDN